MPNPLAAKLTSFAGLSNEDSALLGGWCDHARSFPSDIDLIQEGDRPNVVFLLVEGWACRYKILPDGQRQIVAFLLPGDMCDVQIFILKKMDHSIRLITKAKVVAIPKEKIIELFEQRPALARALWWATLTDEATLREWLVNIGQRDAYERLAHLFAELRLRLEMVGLVSSDTFDFPLTQAELGDTLGLTPIHVNRMLQRMRADGVIKLSGRRLQILDMPRLMAIAQFEPNYLHLEPRTNVGLRSVPM